MLGRTMPYKEILHNIIIINPKYRFVCSIDNHTSDVGRIIDHTNRIVHEDFGQFSVFSNENRSCIIFSSIVYRYNVLEKNNLLNDDQNYTII
jgi:hypothetical protein